MLDSLSSTVRLRLDAVTASGSRRFLREWVAPSGTSVTGPLYYSERNPSKDTTSYLATATYSNGNVVTSSAAFTVMSWGPSLVPTASLASSTQVRVAFDAYVYDRDFVLNDTVASMELSLWSGDRRTCTRSGTSSTFVCLVSRDVWNREKDRNFASSTVLIRSPPRCAGAAHEMLINGSLLTSLSGFPATSGGSGSGTPPPVPSLPNLTINASHNGYDATWSICNTGSAAVSTTSPLVGFTYRADGWMSAMRFELNLRGLAASSCVDGTPVGVSVSSGTGGGATLPAPSVRFCIDTTNVVDEGEGELNNCVDVARR